MQVVSPLLRRIEIYLRRAGTRPTEFGRLAMRDGRFVAQLRLGRKPRRRTEARVNAFLDRAERELGDTSCRRRR